MLGKLIYEFDGDDPKETETKIKRSLKYYGYGPYEQRRVDHLRSMKNWLKKELTGTGKSRYYTKQEQVPGLPFDVERLANDLVGQYPDIPRSEIDWFIPNAIYLYYLR